MFAEIKNTEKNTKYKINNENTAYYFNDQHNQTP